MNSHYQRIIESSAQLKLQLMRDEKLMRSLKDVGDKMVNCFRNQKKVLWCGNGGSAADAQHLSAELSGRFYYNRPPLNSEALHVNTSYLTAVANDYGYEEVYARLVKGMGQKGDMLVGLSTSGNSKNVIKAMEIAIDLGMITVGFTGNNGGNMKAVCSYLLDIPSSDTPRIQECHLMLGHALCEWVELEIFPNK